jgi:serine/threonine protein kinase
MCLHLPDKCFITNTPLHVFSLVLAAEKADVWSLGVVFWEMLTLEVPFADMPPAQLIGGGFGQSCLLLYSFFVCLVVLIIHL